MRALPFALLLLAAPAAAQELASLRTLAVVDEPVVRLSDLFDNLGERGDKVLGPAPAPGTRVVVEASQLLAIARANRIAWRPVGGIDRVVLERPGRAITRDEVALAVRGALRGQGLEEGMDLDLQGFTAPMAPEGAFVQLVVEGAVLDLGVGRFAATLALLAEGAPTQRLRIGGRVVETVPMLVAARRMSPGEVVGAADVKLIRVSATRLRPGAAQAAEGVVGQALRRPAAADQPLMLADLTRPAAIERGQTVTMLYEAPGMTLSAQGRAMEAAARGTPVPVMNLMSRVVVQAEVIAPGRVRVGIAR